MPQQQVNGQPPNGLGMTSAGSSLQSSRASWGSSSMNGHLPQPAYTSDAPHLPLNGLQLDSNRSSRSNSIHRPASSSSEDKKRFSNASSLATVQNSLETSPPNSHHSVNGAQYEQKFDPASLQRDRLHGQTYPKTSSPAYYQQAASNGATSLAQHSEQQPQFYYAGHQYSNLGPGPHGDHENHYPGYFTPGGDNSLLFSAQQS